MKKVAVRRASVKTTSAATGSHRRRPGARVPTRRAGRAVVGTRKNAVASSSDRPHSKGKSTSTDGKGGSPEEGGVGNIDKVRDILFGGQMRDYERRFAKLEERLARDTAELKDEVKKRLTALTDFVKNETETLASRIKTEHDERTDATKELSRELREASKAVDKKTGQLDDQITRAQRELRQQLLDLNKQLTDEIGRKANEVLARLAQESHELRVDKADRATIAALLQEVALRLTNELTLPGAKE
jgi:gas vesicle protein